MFIFAFPELNDTLIKAAIFDYGETLVSPKARDEKIVPWAMLAAYKFLVQAGLKISYEEFVPIDMTVFRKYGQMEAEEDRDIPDVIKYYELLGELFPTKSQAWRHKTARQADAAFWGVVARHYSASRGAARSLSELKSMGLRMAVLSNHHSHRALVEHLRHLGLYDYFLRVFSSAQLGVRKPDSRAFTKCLSALGVSSDVTVFIGDSIKFDIAGAKACKMKTIFVRKEVPESNELSGADFEVTRLEEIPSIIRRLNRAKPE